MTDAELDARVDELRDEDVEAIAGDRDTEARLLWHRPRRTVRRLAAEVSRLRRAVRRHRDYRGDHRCHLDDGELYAVLPEGDTRPSREAAVTIENCQRFIDCRQQGREYVSPQTRIEELEAEVRRLQDELTSEQNRACLLEDRLRVLELIARSEELRLASLLRYTCGCEAVPKAEGYLGFCPEHNQPLTRPQG